MRALEWLLPALVMGLVVGLLGGSAAAGGPEEQRLLFDPTTLGLATAPLGPSTRSAPGPTRAASRPPAFEPLKKRAAAAPSRVSDPASRLPRGIAAGAGPFTRSEEDTRSAASSGFDFKLGTFSIGLETET